MNFVQKVKIRFLSRPFFTLCITMDVEPKIAKLYKMAQQLLLQELQRKGGWRMKKKKCLHRFSYDKKIESVWPESNVHPTARVTSYCLLPDTFWLRAFKNASKVGTVTFANLPSPTSIVKKVGLLIGIKSTFGLKPCRPKVKGVNITSPSVLCSPSLISLTFSVDVSSRP